jgi:hypothetical protein
VSGSGMGVPYDDPIYYALYWGAGLGMSLNQGPEAGALAGGYAALDHGIKGFRFTVTNLGGSVIRFKYKILGDANDYCTTVTSGTNLVYFTGVRQNCWTVGGAALSTTQQNSIEALAWQVPTEYYYSTPFSFCISDITPVTG